MYTIDFATKQKQFEYRLIINQLFNRKTKKPQQNAEVL
jgi:hypothetical protein